MNYQEILLSAKMLSSSEQARLISELLGLFQEDYLSFRRQQLFDKQGCCPWCEGKNYYKYGTEKGSQRFKCKERRRTFTENIQVHGLMAYIKRHMLLGTLN